MHTPGVVATDRELALLNAIASVFPTATSILYKRHINRAVLRQAKQNFRAHREQGVGSDSSNTSNNNNNNILSAQAFLDGWLKVVARVVNWSGYHPTRTGPDRTGSGFGLQTQIPGPGICFPPGTRTKPNVPGPDRMHLYLGSVSQNI